MALSGAGSTSRGHGDDEDQVLVAGSQFFLTLADGVTYLDGKHAPFGTAVEGQEDGEALDKINRSFTDDENRPLRDIRIKHVIVLDDPFPDPQGLLVPSRTPSPTPEQLRSIRLGEGDEVEDQRTEEEKEEARRKADSSAAALTLEMVGDLPFAEIRPPENILFVCKLNPVTRSEDLELIFSRFGKILSCEVIRDKKSGDSLQYAFIEFDEKQSAEQAYFKMDSVLIDNQRIRVDFSQSVSKLHGRWIESRTGRRQQPSQAAGSPPRRNGRNYAPSAPGSSRDMLFDVNDLAGRAPRDEGPDSRRHRHDSRRDDRDRGPSSRHDEPRALRSEDRNYRRREEEHSSQYRPYPSDRGHGRHSERDRSQRNTRDDSARSRSSRDFRDYHRSDDRKYSGPDTRRGESPPARRR